MKIQNFSSILNYAVLNSKNDGSKDFERYFDDNMQMSSSYINKICENNFQDEEITSESLNEILLKDYDDITNNTFFSSSIYRYTMKYVAIKYLESHRSEIPELKKEIIEKNMTFDENETYTDDFHQNLLLAVLSMEVDFNQFYENMADKNKECLDEINELKNNYGKEEGFKRFCAKYDKIKAFPATLRRAFISYAHLIIFDIEGIDEEVSPKSPIIKYKNKYSLKEYITTFSERMEENFREELVNSIVSLAYQIDKFGMLVEYNDKHSEKVRRVCLPGLKYATIEDETSDNPSINTLFRADNLQKLDLDVLLRMNSFYNNRLAKIIRNYSMSLFILDETSSVLEILNGETLSKNSISEDVLNNLMLKFQVLSLPIKAFYNETQKDIENNLDNYSNSKQEIDELSGKKQVVLSMDYFIKQIKKVWKREYEEYFKKRIPNDKSNLTQDLLLVNLLYNPIFLSYKFKDLALKSEYAYMHYLSQEKQKFNYNYGIVLQSQDENPKNILIASDGGLNFPNRLHTKKDSFVDFVKSYTNSPLIRIYEGIEDFDYFGDYITAQLLLPLTKKQIKYLKNLSIGKVSEEDSHSNINEGNEDMVEHILYSLDRTRIMKKHRVQITKYDKKGNPKSTYIPRVRYIDSRDNQIYTLNEHGKLVNDSGQEIEMNGEKPQDERSNNDR